MEDLNLLLFNKLREYDRFMRMQENLYRNLTDDEKTELIRLLNKILDSDEEEKASEAKETKPLTPFKAIGEGMTCGPDGCHF